jgi:hypothetical protein
VSQTLDKLIRLQQAVILISTEIRGKVRLFSAVPVVVARVKETNLTTTFKTEWNQVSIKEWFFNSIGIRRPSQYLKVAYQSSKLLTAGGYQNWEKIPL